MGLNNGYPRCIDLSKSFMIPIMQSLSGVLISIPNRAIIIIIITLLESTAEVLDQQVADKSSILTANVLCMHMHTHVHTHTHAHTHMHTHAHTHMHTHTHTHTHSEHEAIAREITKFLDLPSHSTVDKSKEDSDQQQQTEHKQKKPRKQKGD